MAPVIIRDRRGVCGLGSAFCVAALSSRKALYVTAQHVVDEFVSPIQHDDYAKIQTREGREPFLLLPRGLVDPADVRALQGVRIEQVWLAQNHNDLAMLTVDLSGFNYPPTAAVMFHLALAPPSVGDACCALGYADMVVGHPSSEDANTSQWQGPLHASQAVIEEVHPSGRDRAMLSFPCFRTSAFYAPGMSGGPIARPDGRIVGVVSTSYERGIQTAYGALIGAIIGARMRLPDDDGQPVDLDFPSLQALGVVSTDEIATTLDRTDDGASLEWPSEM